MDDQQQRRAVPIAIGLAIAFAAGVVVLVMRPTGALPSARGWIVLGIAVAVVILAVGVVLVRRKRARAAGPPPSEAAAQRLGLAYRKKVERGFHHGFGPLPGIPRGGDVRHLFEGTLDGRQFTAFEHSYVVNTGQAVIPIIHAVFLTAAPEWPSVTVARRGAFGRLLRRLGRHGGFELDDPAFNAAFKVKTDDEDFALTLLHPDMQQFMLEKPSATWRVHAGCAALIYSGRLRMDRMDASLDRLGRFWTQVPTELERW